MTQPAGQLHVIETQTEDGKFMCLANDKLGVHLAKGKVWEPHFRRVVSVLLKPGDRVADIGAHIGYNSVVLSKLVGPSGQVFAFEPVRLVYQQLCGNCALNGLTNVWASNVAIGERDNESAEMEPLDFSGEDVHLMAASIGHGASGSRCAPSTGWHCQRCV